MAMLSIVLEAPQPQMTVKPVLHLLTDSPRPKEARQHQGTGRQRHRQ
jgi:hypothetical protein